MKKQTYSQFCAFVKENFSLVLFVSQFKNLLGYNYLCSIIKDDEGWCYVYYRREDGDPIKRFVQNYADGLDFIKTYLI